MGIYFRDILLIRISRGANNCGQHSLEKNMYFIMRFSPDFQSFYFNDRLEFCEFFEWKIKRIYNADLFSQPPLLIFIKGANISGGHYIYIYIYKIKNNFNVWCEREAEGNLTRNTSLTRCRTSRKSIRLVWPSRTWSVISTATLMSEPQ